MMNYEFQTVCSKILFFPTFSNILLLLYLTKSFLNFTKYLNTLLNIEHLNIGIILAQRWSEYFYIVPLDWVINGTPW